MNTNKPEFPHVIIAICAVLLFGLGVYHFRHVRLIPAPPPAAPASSLNLVDVFKANPNLVEARRDAGMFAAICDEFAADLALDGTRPEAEQLVTTGTQLDTKRKELRWYSLDGISLGKTYPQLGPTLAQYLDKAAGTKADALTPDQRQSWVQAMKSLGQAAESARKSL